ncbi:sigma-70 family RNA polymerase sigma factor [Oceanobacter kriegii]|uniref:sigma-70 family RNA polymerase sigma factor n=1 Tax=Oceanobacter kriegii TaxID=64972 RepID=UPI0004029BF0|nr:sigma-70 family RNA polymerase sigma factor [Oceanobacter kriegii]
MTELTRERSIADVFADHHSWLKRWLMERTGCNEQAADLAQDTFVKVLCKQPTFEQAAAERKYLKVVADRLCIDMWRRRALEQAWLESIQQQPEAVDISPETQTMIIESFLDLDRRLRALPDHIANAFIAHKFEGLGYRAIAEQQNVTERTVKNWMAKAMLACIEVEAELDQVLAPA